MADLVSLEFWSSLVSIGQTDVTSFDSGEHFRSRVGFPFGKTNMADDSILRPLEIDLDLL